MAVLAIVFGASGPATSSPELDRPPAPDGAPRSVEPVLEFPEPGLDDLASYRGYRTRFYRDAAANPVQIYLNGRTGRVVHLWADAANESIGFTARDRADGPASLEWTRAEATIGRVDGARWLAYGLTADPGPLDIGFFLLGSMRVERDFQYREGHLRPFGSGIFVPGELEALVENVARLEPEERRRHLEPLRAVDVSGLRRRLRPTVERIERGDSVIVRVTRPSLDGRNRLELEIAVARSAADVVLDGRVASVRPRGDRPTELVVRIATDAAPLTPLSRDGIFNTDFLRFFERARAAAESVRSLAAGARTASDEARLLEFRRLERQVRSVELVSYREKLMAGLPNFATYFGRDMLMSALMMSPIWSDAMTEHVIATALRKLGPAGEVSHEEALGGQAVREHAAIYNDLVEGVLRRGVGAAPDADTDTTLRKARSVLGRLQAVRENYRMVDDDFQLPVLVARYLTDDRVPLARRRAFLLAPVAAGRDESRLDALLRNLSFVVERAGPYARDPVPTKLIGFLPRDSAGWVPGSWRDSDAGYAGGRFAMDVNAIWVPHALDAVRRSIAAFREMGFGPDDLARATRRPGGPPAAYLRDPSALTRAIDAWRGAERHFIVRLEPHEARERIHAKLAWMPAAERRHWRSVLDAHPVGEEPIEFAAVALDADGRPIPVMNTDPAMALFIDDPVARLRAGSTTVERLLRDLRPFTTPYPVGLFIDGLGPVAANDAYAPRTVWERFATDRYHSPYVVWGREVNLLLLGLAAAIEAAEAATDDDARPEFGRYAAALRRALERTRAAVDASGLAHNELWSYRFESGRLAPVRYGGSTDVQLWNLTELAVRFTLDRLARAEAGT